MTKPRHISLLENLLIFVIAILNVPLTTASVNWSCSTNVTGFPLNIDMIGGVWYEVARIPDESVPACMKLTAASTVIDDAFDVQVDYVNNVNNKWTQTQENVTFPWDNNTQNGIFELVYGTGDTATTVTFKVVETDYESVAVVCGYATISAITLLKIWTREADIDATTMQAIQALADKYELGSYIGWVDQSDRCNSVAQPLPLMGLLLLFALLTLKGFFR